ncbi:SusD/RagB family nutrient-binding outer membrane lipoprotein [Mangrovibacterium marinum]|uniref:SusD/RagB-like outer membrane lipoprotein n=1 Tax=Mangrovibacterium marinum TaxID=1639118 RepID=A0A2T5C089_9BACT|nr:SusD/RagB family nutrient-binding outer membrane lipoprotein [Mangrovibacterium marinum]PTN07991.1 SusD/RagB-like outer membrane lipoprotein [Mangrovibacterium marinum]
MKKILFIFLVGLLANACTDGFEEANINPYEISSESLKQDNNDIGSYFPSLLSNIFGHQIEENLIAESFCDYMATPTPFVSGVNNTTYYITWNTYWNRIYNNLMSPSGQVIRKALDDDKEVFAAWAKLIRILGMSRLTTYHGPVIYTEYGQANAGYDSEADLYDAFFSDLDDIQAVFSANEDYPALKAFDASYDGSVAKWEMLVNSMRLKLAIRISEVAPELAKAEGEKAIADPAGLILSNTDNFEISLYGSDLYLAIICFQWNDTRMSAGMESFLVGLKDPRIDKYFQRVNNSSLVADHPDYPYKGIRNGAELVAKGDHTSYSLIAESFATVTERPYLAAAEVYFDLAEAALRGWDGAGDAAANYEAGVRASFEQWGAGGVDAYLADATSTPIDYNDVVYDNRGDGSINDFISRSTVTVAWDEAANNEVKLEKIITQKWIAGFTNPNEPWADFRRTGYPKLPHVYQNSSNGDWGVIPADDWIRRMPFVDGERQSNPEGVAAAVATMKGGDLISTRLWWDTGGSNF